MAKVLLKKSSVSGNAPGTGDLEYGEVAINFADGRLYYKNSSNEIKSFNDTDLADSDRTVALSNYLRLSGDTMTGVLDMGTNRIINLSDPIAGQDGATKKYVDDAVAVGNYPKGDYGRVDSASTSDAFGVLISISSYDHMDPSGSIVTVDHGTDSSI